MDIVSDEKKEFFFIDSEDYSLKSFQKFIFKNINITAQNNISFHRSDFRGAQMNKCQFKGVDFSRSDFIAMSLENVTFENSSFKSCTFLNNVFDKVIFKNNENNALDLLRSSFYKCKFENETFLDCTWNNLIFNKTEFNNFTIEKSTIQNIEFRNCNLKELNFSRLTAIDLRFRKCTLTNIIFDPDYLGSYCFDKNSLGDISYSYKDEVFKLDITNVNNIKDYSKHLLTSDRFSEVFGLSAILTIKGLSKNHKLDKIWLTCLDKSCKLLNHYEAIDNIKQLSKSLKFYLNENLFNVTDIVNMIKEISFLKEKYLDAVTEEYLFFILSYLKEYIEKAKYSYDDILYSNETNKLVYTSFTIDTNSFLDAEKILKNIFIDILEQNKNTYFIVDSKKGSIIMIVLATLVSILGIFKLISSYHNIVFQFILNNKKFKNELLLEDKKTEIIKNLDTNIQYTLKDLMEQNQNILKPDLIKDLKAISELQVYID